MTTADQKIIKEMTMELIGHFEEVLDLKLQIINHKLDATIIQTTKTNGSVQGHSERIRSLEARIPHTIANCPQQNTIQELRDESITKKSMKKMLVTTVLVIGTLVGIVATVVALIQEHNIQ